MKECRMGHEKGLIFHIIHGSFVDGYGIRTTVFLKGCPLRCLWCCNPEGQENYPEIKYAASKCNGCGRCVTICPSNAIHIDFKGNVEKAKIERKLCTNCGECIEDCYTGALDFFGRYYTVMELFEEVKKDEQFYRSSGGGVTIGGGEATSQGVFTLQLIRKFTENHIHTALDTCGHITTAEGMKALEEVDLALFDLKGIDPVDHLRNTGMSNNLILKNLKRRNATGKPIIIRVPIIPGYTDSTQNAESSAEFLSRLKSVERVDLLAYHRYGITKYEELGRKYPLDNQAIAQESLDPIKSIYEQHGLKVQLGG